MVVPNCAQLGVFLDDAVAWQRDGTSASLVRLITAPWSGVEHDVGAAYAALGRRGVSILETIERGRLSAPPDQREQLLRFARNARRVRELSTERDDAAVRAAVADIFGLGTVAAEEPPPYGVPADEEFVLADPREPEPSAPIPPWRHHFSASSLNTYAECARKWFYKYACGAIEDPASSAGVYGKALHVALEDFHGEFPRPRRGDEAAMRRRIRECVNWAFNASRDGFATAVEFALQVRRAQRTAQRYVDWLIVQAKEAPFVVLGREVAASLEMDGRPFVGYIDRLDRDEISGGVRVVDYKTGHIAMSASEYCEKVRRFRDFQLPFYYWARTAEGDRVTKLVLIPLKDALLDVRPIVLDVVPRGGPNTRDEACGTIGTDELERSRTRMMELSDKLASGTMHHCEPTKESEACTYCAYALACVQRPAQKARRFGS
ncbi:MAG: PD-(D/E)XK nuclease family protein [Candidatus Eremiobacteraeota bacterium]|nr:PD-(D/E)XK nuclease family protein [Candidatus Eremiobacteraeota bacterium]